VTQGLLTTWRVELGEKAQASAVPSDPWGKVRLAQKQVALGKGQEAAATLNSLRGSADPDRAWSALFWSTLLDADRLQGNREQAWKDLAEYKVRFKAQADPELDRLLAGV
jgi:predicted Zn-dependent protease